MARNKIYTEKQRAQRLAECQKKYYEENQDKILERNRSYYEIHRADILKKCKEKRQKQLEKIKEDPDYVPKKRGRPRKIIASI